MRHLYPLICVFILLLYATLFAACASRRSEPAKQKVFVARNNDVAEGEKLYMIYCHKCHPAGEAGLGPSINANPAPQFVKRFQVRHGLGAMPSFKKDEISVEDLHDISEYLRAWKSF